MDISDVPCGTCQRDYTKPHVCEVPSHCPCDRHSVSPEMVDHAVTIVNLALSNRDLLLEIIYSAGPELHLDPKMASVSSRRRQPKLAVRRPDPEEKAQGILYKARMATEEEEADW